MNQKRRGADAGVTITPNHQYWDRSPLKWAKNVKTPTLILHSDDDYRLLPMRNERAT